MLGVPAWMWLVSAGAAGQQIVSKLMQKPQPGAPGAPQGPQPVAQGAAPPTIFRPPTPQGPPPARAGVASKYDAHLPIVLEQTIDKALCAGVPADMIAKADVVKLRGFADSLTTKLPQGARYPQDYYPIAAHVLRSAAAFIEGERAKAAAVAPTPKPAAAPGPAPAPAAHVNGAAKAEPVVAAPEVIVAPIEG